MKKGIEKIVKNIKKSTIKIVKDFRKDPKKTVLTILNAIVEAIKNNTLFVSYIVLNVFIGILLRFFTIHTMENLFLIKPILADLSIVLFLGGISFGLKEKNRFPYLLCISIIFT